MERRFKSISLFEFKSLFTTDQRCSRHLSELKWSNGVKCGNDKFCIGYKSYDRQCTRCNHVAPPTAGTLFHKSKLPILKALYIIYFLATTKNGISSTESSRTLALREKTCWFFK
jgi:hypothetical protein